MKNTSISALAFVLLLASRTLSQWQPVLTSGVLNINAFATIGPNLFAGGDSCGVFLSSNGGLTWKSMNKGLLDTTVFSLATSGDTIYAATGGGVFISTNNGALWSIASSGLPQDPTFFGVSLVLATQNRLFASVLNIGMYYSTNKGQSWKSLNNGLTYSRVIALAANDSCLFAGTSGGGLFRVSLNDTTWSPVNNGLTSNWIPQLLSSGPYLFAGTADSAIFISTNNGTSWSQCNQGLSPTQYRYVAALAANDSIIFAIVNTSLYFSTNNGSKWTKALQSPPDIPKHLAITDSSIFIAAYTKGVWKSSLKQVLTSVENSISNSTPTRYSLSQNFPNPFNSSTVIGFYIDGPSSVSLRIYNLLGQEIETIVDTELLAGSYQKTWKADQYAGGVYFYTLTAHRLDQIRSFSQTRKLVLLK